MCSGVHVVRLLAATVSASHMPMLLFQLGHAPGMGLGSFWGGGGGGGGGGVGMTRQRFSTGQSLGVRGGISA